jgi:hypothetical protein
MVKSFITLGLGVNVTKLFVSVNVASTYSAKVFANDLTYFGFDDKGKKSFIASKPER